METGPYSTDGCKGVCREKWMMMMTGSNLAPARCNGEDDKGAGDEELWSVINPNSAA